MGMNRKKPFRVERSKGFLLKGKYSFFAFLNRYGAYTSKEFRILTGALLVL